MALPFYHLEIRVPEEAIDALGHVNNCEYVRWMERAATEHSAAVGWTMRRFVEGRLAFVVRSNWIEYLRPCYAGETLVLTTWVETMDPKLSVRRHCFRRDGKIVACGATEWAFVDMGGPAPKAIAIPEEVASCFTPVDPADPILREMGVARACRHKVGQ